MAKSVALAGLLLLLGTLLVSATTPFAELSAEAPIYVHLQHYALEGLLGSPAPKLEKLSRLEAAMLVKKSLVAYGESQLAGKPADSASEAALSTDLEEFKAELSLLGLENAPQLMAAATPSPGTPAADAAPAAASTSTGDPAADNALACCEKVVAPEPAPDPCAPQKIKFTPYGDIAMQLRQGRTAIAGGGSLEMSDMTAYWAEIGVDAATPKITAHASVLLNTNDSTVDLHEAYVGWESDNKDWRVKAGRIVLPPGSRPTVFPTYPAAVDLTYTTADAVGVDIGKGNTTVSAYGFKPAVDIAGFNSEISDYSIGTHFKTADDACGPKYEFAASMTSHLGASDLLLAGAGPAQKRVGGANVWGQATWDGGNRALAEYSWAFNRFDPADLDANADGVGDRPAAFDAEFVHTTPQGQEYGVSYEQTSQMVDYAQTRYTLLAGRKIDDFSTLRLELSRGTYGDYVTNAAKHDLRFVAELRVKF